MKQYFASFITKPLKYVANVNFKSLEMFAFWLIYSLSFQLLEY